MGEKEKNLPYRVPNDIYGSPPPGDADNLPSTLSVGWTFKEQSLERGT